MFVKSGKAFWRKWDLRWLSKENVISRLFEVGGRTEGYFRVKNRVQTQREE